MGDNSIKIDIAERIAVLKRHENGWALECNLVSWNGGPYKIDIREWSPDHERMTRGLAIDEISAEKLARALADRYREKSAKSRISPDKDDLER